MKSGNSIPRTIAGANDQAPPIWRQPLDAWNHFWFAPQDPTILGVMRICVGLLALYTLVAYTRDLQDFFGQHAWLDHQTRIETAREAPWAVETMMWPAPRPAPLARNDWQKNYVKAYFEKWREYPPLPWPESEEEASKIDDFRLKWGGDPRDAVAIGAPIWSLWFHITDDTVMLLVHLLIIFITFLFTIGFGTRVTSVLTWFGALCYLHRSPPTLFGVDTMMLITMMYLMVGPSGAALSVDRLIAWLRRRRSGIVSGVTPSVSANLAIRLLQVHLCFIYGAAGLAKLKGNSWWRGDAIWGTIANFEFAPMQNPIYMFLLESLTANQFVLQVFLACGTWFTLLFEIGYASLVWNRYTRWLMLFMALVLHGFIGMLMGLRTFSFMMLVMNMVFLPAPVVRWIVGQVEFAVFSLMGLFGMQQVQQPRLRQSGADSGDQAGVGAVDSPETHLQEPGRKLRVKRGAKSRRKRSEM